MDRAITGITRAAEIAYGPGCRGRPIFPAAGAEDVAARLRVDELLLQPDAGAPWASGRGEVVVNHVLTGALRYEGSEPRSLELPQGSGLIVGPGRQARPLVLRGAGRGPTRVLRVRVRPSPAADDSAPSVRLYQAGDPSEIRSDRAVVRVIAGASLATIHSASLTCLHVRLDRGAEWAWSLPGEQKGLAYVLGGSARFGATGVAGKRGDILILGCGERVRVIAARPVEFVLVGTRESRRPFRVARVHHSG